MPADPNAPGLSDYWVDTLPGDPVLRPWDQLSIGPLTFPGVWQIEPTTSISFDTPKPRQSTVEYTFKNYLLPLGYNPARVRATGQIWTAADWKLLQTYLPLIAPRKTNSALPTAHPIAHPACVLLGIDLVVITAVSIPPVRNQILTVVIEMLQWFQQAPAYGIFGTGSTGNTQATPALQNVPNVGDNLVTA